MEGLEAQSNNQTELIKIAESILVNMKILEKKQASLSFQEAITKLH